MLNACAEAHALAPLRFARAVEMWYFGNPASTLPFWGILSQIFEHFRYLLGNGLGNKTCFIPLGRILFLIPWEYFFLIPVGIRLYFCQTLTQNGLEIIVLGPF